MCARWCGVSAGAVMDRGKERGAVRIKRVMAWGGRGRRLDEPGDGSSPKARPRVVEPGRKKSGGPEGEGPGPLEVGAGPV